MDTSKYSRSRGHTMGSNKRVPPYLVLVLLVIGAAALSVGILYKMRERGVLTVLQERDQQLISLQVLLEKEKEVNKEIRRKVDELEAKTSILSIERAELKNKLMDSETTTTYLTNTQKELDAAFVEKESYINQMKENAAASTPEQTTSIKEFLQQKEAERTETSSDSIPATAEENFNNATATESRHQDESIVIGANNENATSDTVVLDKSENSNDSVPTPAEEQSSDNTSTSESNNQDSIPTPAAEQNSDKTTASESRHQDESIVVGANNKNATSDTVMLDKSENSNDSVPTPAEEQNSNNTYASESSNQDYKPTPAAEQNSDKNTASESNNQDESTVGGANNDHAANETEVPDKYANSTDSIPAPAEEEHSYNATALESNQQDNSSTEEQFLRLTTNIEDGQLQENKVDGNEHSDDAPEGSHSSDKSKVPQLSHKLADNQESGKEQPDGTRQIEDPQSEVSSHSKDSKLLEMEDGNAVVKEPEKEVNPEGKPEISEDRLSESNQNTAQAVETVAVPTDANSSMSTNSDERKKTSKRHRRRFKSRSKKRTTVAASNNDGSHQMEVDAAGNT